jgi:hypothetical protein
VHLNGCRRRGCDHGLPDAVGKLRQAAVTWQRRHGSPGARHIAWGHRCTKGSRMRTRSKRLYRDVHCTHHTAQQCVPPANIHPLIIWWTAVVVRRDKLGIGSGQDRQRIVKQLLQICGVAFQFLEVRCGVKHVTVLTRSACTKTRSGLPERLTLSTDFSNRGNQGVGRLRLHALLTDWSSNSCSNCRCGFSSNGPSIT